MSVNIAGIECIDTAGAQVLLGAGQRARERGCEFLIRSPSTTVGRALEAHARAEAAAPAGVRRDDSVSCIAVVGEA